MTKQQCSVFSGWVHEREWKPQGGQRSSGLTLRSIEWRCPPSYNILHTLTWTHRGTHKLNRIWRAEMWWNCSSNCFTLSVLDSVICWYPFIHYSSLIWGIKKHNIWLHFYSTQSPFIRRICRFNKYFITHHNVVIGWSTKDIFRC